MAMKSCSGRGLTLPVTATSGTGGPAAGSARGAAMAAPRSTRLRSIYDGQGESWQRSKRCSPRTGPVRGIWELGPLAELHYLTDINDCGQGAVAGLPKCRFLWNHIPPLKARNWMQCWMPNKDNCTTARQHILGRWALNYNVIRSCLSFTGASCRLAADTALPGQRPAPRWCRCACMSRLYERLCRKHPGAMYCSQMLPFR